MSPIYASAGEGKTYAPAPEGTHQAICVDVLDQGLHANPFKDGALQHKIDIVWQIDESREDGKRFLLYKRYTLSLHEKATLRHDLESWRGRAFTPEELKRFDVETVKGVNCLINVQHKSSADGQRTYANVLSVMPLLRNMARMEAVGYERKAESVPDQPAAPEEMLTEDAIPF